MTTETYVDGVPYVSPSATGDPRYVWTAVSVDAIDQMQLQTNGYSALYEGQGNLNFSLKQGGAKQHGQAYWFVRNTAFDTWGFWGKAPNPLTGIAKKPVEHSNEFGINLGGPLLPFGKMKDKLFYFFNYNGFHYSAENPPRCAFRPVQSRRAISEPTTLRFTTPTRKRPAPRTARMDHAAISLGTAREVALERGEIPWPRALPLTWYPQASFRM